MQLGPLEQVEQQPLVLGAPKELLEPMVLLERSFQRQLVAIVALELAQLVLELVSQRGQLLWLGLLLLALVQSLLAFEQFGCSILPFVGGEFELLLHQSSSNNHLHQRVWTASSSQPAKMYQRQSFLKL